MTAPARRHDAANYRFVRRDTSDLDLWQEAVSLRHEWLDHGLSTQPADRPAAELHLIAIYARLSRPRPRFEWVDSPQKALPLIGDLPTLDELYRWARDPRPRGTPPLGSDLAMVTSQLRSRLSADVQLTDPEPSPVRRNKRREPWPELPPPAAFAAGIPLNVVLHQAIRSALHRSLGSGFRQPVRRLLAAAHGPQAVCWYGQQDAAWIGYYDILRRLGLARYGPDDAEHLNHWIAVTRSCGWWWPGEHVCVVVERPESVQVEPVPRALHDEVRLRRDGVRYRDGWCPAVG